MRIIFLICGVVGLLTACGGGGSTTPSANNVTPLPTSIPPPVPTPPATPTLSLMAQVGEKIFNDRNLSGSGRMSCATCHDPAFFHGPPNSLPVQVGGTFENEFGLRAAPSLRYLERNPAFTAGAGHAAELSGGLMADGRANTLAQQARLPLFNSIEMDNLDVNDLARKLRRSVYADLFSQVFGNSDADTTVTQMQQALQAFQLEDPRFHPYDSKYDQFLAGRVSLSVAEQRGLQVFNDPARGNCNACHTSASSDGKPPLFTNFSYAALGVPRNSAIPRNADAAYFDLGVCGPNRSDLSDPQYCGLFRTPTLRNVAKRPSLFHNGVMHSLKQAVQFYNTRDTSPQSWYPLLNGQVQKFNDLPARYVSNLTLRAPLDGRSAGSRSPMSDQEVDDLVCFLQTLTDDYHAGIVPPDPACVN